MPHYLVIKQCKYVADGKPYFHRVGDMVELDDQIAAFLVRHIRAVKAPKRSVEEKYGALASYVDPLLLLDKEQKLSELKSELPIPSIESTDEISKKGKS